MTLGFVLATDVVAELLFVVLRPLLAPALTCTNGAGTLAAGSFFGEVLSLTGTAIAGDYTYVDCSASVPGTLTLTKQ